MALLNYCDSLIPFFSFVHVYIFNLFKTFIEHEALVGQINPERLPLPQLLKKAPPLIEPIILPHYLTLVMLTVTKLLKLSVFDLILTILSLTLNNLLPICYLFNFFIDFIHWEISLYILEQLHYLFRRIIESFQQISWIQAWAIPAIIPILIILRELDCITQNSL